MMHLSQTKRNLESDSNGDPLSAAFAFDQSALFQTLHFLFVISYLALSPQTSSVFLVLMLSMCHFRHPLLVPQWLTPVMLRVGKFCAGMLEELIL